MFCICFFKQKTAYDMRISDWSSDVCSSDLLFGMSGFGVGFGLRRTASGGDLLCPSFALSDLEFLFRRPLSNARGIDPPVFTSTTRHRPNDGSKNDEDYDRNDDSDNHTGGTPSSAPRIPRIALTPSDSQRWETQTIQKS